MTGRKWLLYFAVGSLIGNVSAGKEGKTQTPPKRLTRLVKFSKEWLQVNIRDNEESVAQFKRRKNYYDRVVDNIDKRSDRMLKIYEKTNPDGERRCGFFDPTTTYGGPQLEAPELNEKKKTARAEYLNQQRNRRHNIIEQFKYVSLTPQDWHHIRRSEDLNHIEDKIRELEQWFKENLDNKVSMTGSLIDDDENSDESNHRRRRAAEKTNTEHGKAGTANSRYNKDDALTGWRQIATGFRKWAERYIRYCSKEYTEKSFSKWANEKLYLKTQKYFKCVVEGRQLDDCQD
jgi:hypothetical protein